MPLRLGAVALAVLIAVVMRFTNLALVLRTGALPVRFEVVPPASGG